MTLDIQRFASDPSVYLEFKDLPNTETPIDATNLNLMQSKIKESIDTNSQDITAISKELAEYKIEINIVPNGEPVKTGRKVNGKDEWLVIKTEDNVVVGDDRDINTHLVDNAILHDFNISIKSPLETLIVKHGMFLDDTNFFSGYAFKNGNVHVKTGTATNWITDDMQYHIALYYTIETEES